VTLPLIAPPPEPGPAPEGQMDSLRTSQVLNLLARRSEAGQITFDEIASGLRERAFGMLLLVLGVFGWIPLMPPGFASIFGTGMAVLAWQIMCGRREPWLPGRIGRVGLSRERFRRIVERATPWLERFEAIARPRFLGGPTERSGRLLGAFLLLLGATVMVPLPMTNAFPSLGVVVIAIGLLERDGIIVCLGIVVGVLALAAMLAFWAGAIAGLYMLLH
jgi:hypothetical protein